jgi:hypothetical protein
MELSFLPSIKTFWRISHFNEYIPDIVVLCQSFVGVHDIMFDKPASPSVLYEPPLNGLMITFFGVGVLNP